MQHLVPILVHESQLPGNIRAELLASLRRGELNHKFLYDSPQQTRKWLALHQAYSPSRTDPGCQTAYDQAFTAVAATLGSARVHLVGLGCGGGQKDARLLHLLSQAGASPAYTPVDVSPSMVLTAAQAVAGASPAQLCPGIVCDFAQVRNFAELVESAALQAPQHKPNNSTEPIPFPATDAPIRVITFFGMIPNFEPATIMPAIAGLMTGPDDLLLLSANLAPGPDYDQGMRQILPLYDNALTRDWLMGFLSEIGISAQDGELQFTIEVDPHSELKRITAWFSFHRAIEFSIDSVDLTFSKNSRLRVFFSYRHTCDSTARLLRGRGLTVVQSWLAPSQEEGVFLVKRLKPKRAEHL